MLRLPCTDDVTTASGPSEGFYNARTGALQEGKVRALARTYAQSVQGSIEAMVFNASSAEFTLRYTSRAGAGTPTRVYLHEQWYYPHGVLFAVTPSNLVTGVYSNNLYVGSLAARTCTRTHSVRHSALTASRMALVRVCVCACVCHSLCAALSLVLTHSPSLPPGTTVELQIWPASASTAASAVAADIDDDDGDDVFEEAVARPT